MADLVKYQKTSYAAEQVLQHNLRGSDAASVPKPYVGLLAGDPGEAGTALEPTGGSYARVEGKFDPPEADSPSGMKCVSSAPVEFPTATADWGEITHVGIFNAQTSGKMMYYTELSASRIVKEGDRMMFDAGNLVVSED